MDTCSAAVMCKNDSFMKSSRVKPPAIAAAPPPPTAHKMLRTPRRPSSLRARCSSSRGKAKSSKTQRGVISSSVSSICACKSGARLVAPSSYMIRQVIIQHNAMQLPTQESSRYMMHTLCYSTLNTRRKKVFMSNRITTPKRV